MATDTLIGRDLTSDTVVSLGLRSRMSGLYMIGKQGRGKTNALLSLIIQDIHQRSGLCVLDPHGDLTVDILACIPPHREQDVILLDLQDSSHPFAFDLFAGVDPTDAASLATGEERLIGLFKKVWGAVSWGPRLEDLLANAVHVLFMNPGTTLADLPRLLTEPAYRQTLLARVTSPTVRDYFMLEYHPLGPKAQAAIYGPLMNKVRAFLRHPLLSQIVSQPGATIDFRQVMARRQILLVRLNTKFTEATSLLGAAIVLHLFEAALERQDVPALQRPPFCLYADEFQLFATPTFGDFLQQARKYAVATTLAHQLRSQLSSELQDAVKGAVNVVSFQVMTDDARDMAREYHANRTAHLPDDLFHWAVNHSDPTIRTAVDEILRSLPFVSVRYHADEPLLTLSEKQSFFERRLRQAVCAGNRNGTPFPAPYWYGTFDLEQGAYARLARGFAVLRDRLLATHRIDADELSDLPVGCAAAKLEQDDGRMRQCLVRFPLAITPEHSFIVKTLFDREEPLPATWPEDLNPTFLAAGVRARRIRERTRARYAHRSAAVSGAARVGPGSTPIDPILPLAGAEPTPLPVQVEVDIE